jgi:hypothetical protein
VRTATGLTLIALGAILAFAVNGHPSWLNIQIVGLVVMATGLVGMVVPGSGYAAVRRRIVRRRAFPGVPVNRVDERQYPPYVRVNQASLVGGDQPATVVTSQEEVQQSPPAVQEYFEG